MVQGGKKVLLGVPCIGLFCFIIMKYVRQDTFQVWRFTWPIIPVGGKSEQHCNSILVRGPLAAS
jgi:hypothetical protein